MIVREDKMVALKITKGSNPHEIIEIYSNTALQNEGETLYSTDIKFKSPKNIEKVIFYNTDEHNEFYYIANVKKGIKSTYKNMFEEIKKMKNLIPEEYQNEDKNSWLLISDIKKIDKEYLKQYYAEVDGESLFEKVNNKRSNRLYFYE